MRQSTIFLARLLGLFLLFVTGWMLFDQDGALVRLQTLLSDPALTFTVGLISLGLGLAMVIGHNVWRGGALPVVVTAIGWLILIKAAVLMLIGPDQAMDLFAAWRTAPARQIALGAYLLLALYLTIAGFRPHRASRTPAGG